MFYSKCISEFYVILHKIFSQFFRLISCPETWKHEWNSAQMEDCQGFFDSQ